MKEAFEKILAKLKEVGEIEVQLRGGRCNGKTLSLGYVKGIENAINIVQEVSEEYKDGWIPCSERLPERNITVLATFSNWMNDKMFVRQCRFRGTYWNTEMGRLCISEVIAWQPLPEPYKE